LINKYGGYIIPAIPEKHLLTKVNLASYEVCVIFLNFKLHSFLKKEEKTYNNS
jgi:hypothetical protein